MGAVLGAIIIAVTVAMSADMIYDAILFPEECRERRRRLGGWPYKADKP